MNKAQTNVTDHSWVLYAKEIYKMYNNLSAAAAKTEPAQPIILAGVGAGVVFSTYSDEAKLIQGIYTVKV